MAAPRSTTTLGVRAARSGVVVAGGRVVQGIVGLASVVVLARLLTPTDFGVLAMVLPVALIVGMTLNRGLHVAVMHEEQLSESQITHLFWVAQRFNVLLLGAMAISAPLFARFYREPRVTVVALLWTIALACQALAAFPEALLKRQIRFGALAMIEVGTMIVGVAVAILAASAGQHDIALVLQVVVWHTLRCIGAFAITRWRPGLPMSVADPVIERLVRYGADFGLARAVYWLGRQVDRVIVGYVAGAGALGLYDSARRWSWYPFQELFLSLTDVVVASLSRARHDADRFREYCRRGFAVFLAVPMPAIAFVGMEAELVVRVLLGERWLAAVPMVRIMCGAALVDSIGRLTAWLYTAEGNTREQLRWSLVSTGVTLAAVLGAARFGAVGVTWAFAGATVALAVPGVAYCLRASILSGGDFVNAVWRPAVAAICAAGAWVLVKEWLPAPALLVARLVLDVFVFALAYALAWVVLPGGRRAITEAIEMLRAVTGLTLTRPSVTGSPPPA